MCGVKSSGYCKQLLEKIGLMLHTCVDMCGASEVTAKQMKEMSAAKAVHTISAQCGVYQKTVEPNRRTSAKKEPPRKVTRGVVIADTAVLWWGRHRKTSKANLLAKFNKSRFLRMKEVAVNCIEQQTKLNSQLFVPMLVGTKSVRFQLTQEQCIM